MACQSKLISSFSNLYLKKKKRFAKKQCCASPRDCSIRRQIPYVGSSSSWYLTKLIEIKKPKHFGKLFTQFTWSCCKAWEKMFEVGRSKVSLLGCSPRLIISSSVVKDFTSLLPPRRVVLPRQPAGVPAGGQPFPLPAQGSGNPNLLWTGDWCSWTPREGSWPPSWRRDVGLAFLQSYVYEQLYFE